MAIDADIVSRLVERLENTKKNAMGNGINQCVLCGESFGLICPSSLLCHDSRDPPREEVGPSLVGQNKDEGTRRVATDDSSLESQATGINPTSERWQLVEIPQAFHNNTVDVNTDEEVPRYPARNRAQTIPFHAGLS
uniref:Uncharacterized protein n=1 Tax=Timema tahoe TaxID=61484 RepID=A0A7R9IJR4_9NEOP|nr:unnamed protein product [Timema tahoe]